MFPSIRGGGESADSPAKGVECIHVCHKSPKLCEVSTGLALFHRPLARVRIIRELRSLITLQMNPLRTVRTQGDDEQMDALAFGSDEGEDFETTKKKTKSPTAKVG